MTETMLGYSYGAGGSGPRRSKATVVLGAVVSLMTGLLLGAQAPAAQAAFLPSVSTHDVPEYPDRLAVTPDGTIYGTIESAVGVVIAPRGDQARLLTLPGTSVPFDIAVTSDGSVAYVSRVANETNPNGSVDRVDLVTGAVTPVAGVGATPTEIELTDDGATLVVGSLADSQVVLVDTATDEVRARIPLETQPYALTVAGNIAYVGHIPVVQAIDLSTETVTATGEIDFGTVESLAVVGDRLVAAVVSIPPLSARLLAFDTETLEIKDTIELQPAATEFASFFGIAASASKVYAFWGLDWEFGDTDFSSAVVPVSSSGFGVPEPLETGPVIASALATDPFGRWLSIGGDIAGSGIAGVALYATEDGAVPSATVAARISKKALRVTGTTTAFAPGTQVTVHLRTGKKFVAQRKTTTVRGDGTFTWSQRFRGKRVRVYVAVGNPSALDRVRTKTITVTRAAR